jgi:hypothetical protein
VIAAHTSAGDRRAHSFDILNGWIRYLRRRSNAENSVRNQSLANQERPCRILAAQILAAADPSLGRNFRPTRKTGQGVERKIAET